MEYRAVFFAVVPILLCLCVSMTGCGSNNPPLPPPSPTSPPTTLAPPSSTSSPSPGPTSEAFNCESDVQVANVKKMVGKGMCIDDTSLFDCPDSLLQKWPHTDEDIGYVRLFKASRAGDSEETTTNAREKFVAYVKANNIKVLVGSQITCDPTDDDRDWKYVKLMIEALGKDHVLALAVGNELDQLYHMPSVANSDCLTDIWGGYLYNQTKSRILWAREKLANPELPVTSVFTGEILWVAAGFPDTPQIKLVTYLKRLFDAGEKNFVFTMNFYPIFDPTLKPDATDNTQCDAAVAAANCFNDPSCKSIANLAVARQKVKQFVSSNPAWGITDAPLWIGEIGWSSPTPDTYGGPMKSCPAFFSKYMLYEYYKNFLQWDLTFSGGSGGEPPEKVFYFTMRDASNFGKREYFGLVGTCEDKSCKIQSADTKAPRAQSQFVIA